MKSAPAYSIGTGKRGHDIKSASFFTPGPGSYYPGVTKGFKPPSWRMGTSNREAFKANSTPGPGAYDSIGRVSRSAPKYHFGLKTGTELKVDVPGPGAYDALTLRSTDRKPPSYSFRLKTPLYLKVETPGPGTYDQNSRIRNQSQPAFKIGSASRDDLYRTGNTPGPGTYTTRPGSAYNSHSGPKFPFGTSSRDELHSMSKTVPGPGAYANMSEFESPGKGTTMVPRRPDSAHLASARIPGPGAYEAHYNQKTRSPTYRIGSAKRDFLDSEKLRVPGPGNYNPERPKSAQNIFIGTEMRRTQSESKVPGPGSYTPSMSMYKRPAWHLSSRHEDTTKAKNDRQIPGPGAYSPRVEFVKSALPKYRIGTESRDGLTSTQRNPGPGQYDVRKGIGGPKWGFGTGSRTERGRGNEPGPGHYNVQSTFADVPKYAYSSMPLKIHLQGGLFQVVNLCFDGQSTKIQQSDQFNCFEISCVSQRQRSQVVCKYGHVK